MREVSLFVMVATGAFWSGGCSSTPAEPAIPTYTLGEKAPVGTLIYTIFETQWATQFGAGATARVPQNRFFLVRFEAVNGGSSEAAVPNFTIQDDSGHTFEELTSGEDVPQWAGYLRHARPADSVQGNAVFDAPPAHYKLKLSDDKHAHSALVDIPLSFGSETPEILMPGVPAKP